MAAIRLAAWPDGLLCGGYAGYSDYGSKGAATEMTGLTWHAVYCRPRGERRALENIERQEFGAYLPMCREGRNEPKPLFPRYLFVQFDVSHGTWGKLRSTRGVINVLKADDRPALVPDNWIAEMKEAEGADHMIALVPKRPYAPGDKLTVTDGPFLGHTGILQAASDSERAVLAMHILGKLRALPFSYEDLRKAG